MLLPNCAVLPLFYHNSESEEIESFPGGFPTFRIYGTGGHLGVDLGRYFDTRCIKIAALFSACNKKRRFRLVEALSVQIFLVGLTFTSGRMTPSISPCSCSKVRMRDATLLRSGCGSGRGSGSPGCSRRRRRACRFRRPGSRCAGASGARCRAPPRTARPGPAV